MHSTSTKTKPSCNSATENGDSSFTMESTGESMVISSFLMSTPAHHCFRRKLKAALAARASVLRLDGYVHGQHVLRHALAVREQLQAIPAVVLQPRGVRCIRALLRAWRTLPWCFTDDVRTRTLGFFSTFTPAVCNRTLDCFSTVQCSFRTKRPAGCSAVKQPLVRL